MASTTQGVAFRLERFEWTSRHRLELVGRWSGLGGRRLGQPTLIVRHGGATHRLPATADDPEATEPGTDLWRAVFAWEDEPAAFDETQLEIGRNFIVDLPPPRLRRSRFGRSKGSRPQIGATSPASVVEFTDPLALHAALVAAREEAERAKEELEQVRQQAEHATHEAERAQQRRRAEAERLHTELTTVRTMAEEALARERAYYHDLDARYREVEDTLVVQRAEHERLHEELRDHAAATEDARERAERLHTANEVAEKELADANRGHIEALAHARAEVDRLQGELAGVAADRARWESAARAEIERLSAALAGAEQHAAETETEAGRLRTGLAERDEELWRARVQLGELRTQGEDVERLTAELDDARRHGEESEQLREELAATRGDAEAAATDARRVRARLQAVREQLEGTVAHQQTAAGRHTDEEPVRAEAVEGWDASGWLESETGQRIFRVLPFVVVPLLLGELVLLALLATGGL